MESLQRRFDRAIELLQELHDFAEPSRHYRYAKRSEQAFKDVAEFLKEVQVSETKESD